MLIIKKYPNLSFFIFVFLVTLLFKPVWLFNNGSLGQPGEDDLSYWLHSATIVYDFDLDYKNDYKVREGVFDKDTNIPYHPPGAGYISSPFVLLFSIFDSIEPSRLNPVGSFAYLGYFAASLFYFLIGIHLISKILINKNFKFNKLLIFSALVGTLAHYITTRFMMSHSVEFFLCAFIVYFFENKQNKLFTFKTLIPLSFLFFALSFTRPSTFIYSLSLIGIYTKKEDIKFDNFLKFLFAFLPFIFSHMYLSNILYNEPTIFHNAQINFQEQGFTESSVKFIIFNTLKLLNLFFSPSMGIIWVLPVVFFGIVSILLNRKNRNHDTFFTKLFLFLYFYGAFVVLIVWQGREIAYGQRLLIGLIPFCVVKIAELKSSKLFNFTFGLSTFVSYVGYLYFYSSEILTLRPGRTLWGTNVTFAGERYFINLIFELLSIENLIAIVGKTIYSVNFFNIFSIQKVIEQLSLNVYLSDDKLSEAKAFADTYSSLNNVYLLTATFLIIAFSFIFVRIVFKNK